MEIWKNGMENNKSLSRKNFKSQLRVIGAMTRKDCLHWLRYPTWILYIVVFPTMFVARFVYMGKMFAGPEGTQLDQFARQAGTTDYIGFMIISGCLMWWLMHCLWGIGNVIRHEQLQGTLVQNWLCPVSRFRWLVGSTVFDLLLILIVIGLVLFEGRIFWHFRIHGNLWLISLIAILTLSALHGFAFIFAGLVVAFKEPHVLNEIVGSLLMILCGIVYPVTVLPIWVQKISALIPLTWAAKDIRAIMLRGEEFSAIQLDLVFLAISAVLFPFLGYLVFRIIEYRVRRRGTLGIY